MEAIPMSRHCIPARDGAIEETELASALSAAANDMAKILVLEDDDLFRHYLIALLERAGHEVRSLPNGSNVESVVAAEKFHAVVTDLYMPESDGLDTLRRLKKHSPHIPVIGITSGSPDDPCVRAMLVMGAEQVLMKPLDEPALLRTVERVLTSSPASRK
jgi:two-component system, cell cycle response regulator